MPHQPFQGVSFWALIWDNTNFGKSHYRWLFNLPQYKLNRLVVVWGAMPTRTAEASRQLILTAGQR